MESSSYAADLNTEPIVEDDVEIDPIRDIIDYLVRCASISFKNAHVHEQELRTADKIQIACDIYQQSPTRFLLQFGKYLCPNHLEYFKKLQLSNDSSNRKLQECVASLDRYHSDASRRKRVRNRRYKALQKLQNETDYFSDKQMMLRNPLLYEQLVGQYLTEDEIQERDSVDSENLTLLTMILDTIDRNEMREMKNEQLLEESQRDECVNQDSCTSMDGVRKSNEKQWGAFDIPDTVPSHIPETRQQTMINANERNLLREEFQQEMYSSFIEGRDAEIDYTSIDNNEEYDDLQQISQDAEDKYFDSETNEAETLEEHMDLVEMYKKTSINNTPIDPLDEFMEHISQKINT
ncbi:coiled-coil domain-containing protein 97 [Epargyreus clarus]|uniref:coiled-coil domain-containing protein 97 n=1 Tax=Epargyreus clarus TaxID=520877 RepID=UPI003C306F78